MKTNDLAFYSEFVQSTSTLTSREREREREREHQAFSKIVSSNFKRSVFKINYLLTGNFDENQSIP